MKNRLVSRIISFTQRTVSVVRRSRVPLYSCRRAPHKFKQFQHLAVICLMKYMRTDYRGIVDLLATMPGVMEALGMQRIPHFTTLQKFLQRFGVCRFDAILAKTAGLFQCDKVIAAVDGTGHSSDHASVYYAWRTNKKRHSYVRSVIVIDAEKQCILAQHSNCSVGQNGENSWFMPLINRAAKRLCISAVVADKGYDSEVNHEFVHQDIGAQCMIPVRRGWKNGTVNGHYRRKMVTQFNERLYHRRSKVETVFSVMKRKFGEDVNSRLQPMQNKEAALLAIVYNIYRYEKTHTEAVFCVVFYTAFAIHIPQS